MPDAVIVSALRTPIGTAMKGTLRDSFPSTSDNGNSQSVCDRAP